jgi:hypothetical protein
MKKGPTTLAAIALGALTYLSYLALDLNNSEPPAPVASPYAVVADTVAPVTAPSSPRRLLARKAVKSRRAAVASHEEKPVTAEGEKSVSEIPRPDGWNGRFQKQDLRGSGDVCDIDRPCSPRGRDGVLLVGASLQLNGFRPQLPQSLSLGSYQRRTPLLVYK